tara:strand:+ start:1507 stop:2292 length:786 start_codon:yes stop_codon:yes gene_type:complete
MKIHKHTALKEWDKEPIKIFVGTSETEDKWIERILAYTLHSNTNRKLEITWLRPSMFPDWNITGWGTPFTCFRYAIPEMCNFEGRAIYIDCDQMNFRDIAHLWEIDLEGAAFGMVWDTLNKNPKEFDGTEYERGWYSDSVILMDCEKAQEYLDPIEDIAECTWGYKNIFQQVIQSPYQEKATMIKRLDARWNSFDGCVTDDPCEHRGKQKHYDIDDIWQLHFTSLSSQPWHPKYSPHGKAPYAREDISQRLWEIAYKVADI